MENQTNQRQTNEIQINPQAKTLLILTKVFALVSGVIVLLFNVSVVVNIIRLLINIFEGHIGFINALPVLLIQVCQLLVVAVAVVFIILNIVSLAKKSNKRITGLLTVIFSVAATGFLFLCNLIFYIIEIIEYELPISAVISSIIGVLLPVIICFGLFIAYLVCYLLYNKKCKCADAPTQTDFAADSESVQDAEQVEGYSSLESNVSIDDTTQTAKTADNASKQNAEHAAGYFALLPHVLLMIFIGWVWQYVWIARVTKYLNERALFNRSVAAEILLCIFIPYYNVFFIYKAAQAIDEIGAPYNKGNIATMCLIFQIFTGIVSPILMQKKINDIIEIENGKVDES